MTALLEQAMAAIEKLPADTQDAIATRLLAEVALQIGQIHRAAHQAAHVHPFLHEAPGRALANEASGAGNQRDLAGEFHVFAFPLWRKLCRTLAVSRANSQSEARAEAVGVGSSAWLGARPGTAPPP